MKLAGINVKQIDIKTNSIELFLSLEFLLSSCV